MPIMSRSQHQYPAPDGSKSGLIPIEYANTIIQEAVENSLALGTFRRVTMPTGVHHLPVLNALPVASWVNGEPDSTGTGGEKATANQQWKGVVLTAEELAAIVVIPEAVLEDSSIDLWTEIAPRLGESIGRLVDLAVFPGTNKPASWPTAIVPGAAAAGNNVVIADPTVDEYNDAFGKVEADGFMVNRIFADTGQMAAFRGMNAAGVPVYLTDLRDDGRVDSLFGTPITYDRMGALGALAVVGDPSKALLGVRRDLEYKFLDQATIDISDAQDGSALVNLAQQDSIALRVRARFGFAVANPVTHLEPDENTRYPFATITAS